MVPKADCELGTPDTEAGSCNYPVYNLVAKWIVYKGVHDEITGLTEMRRAGREAGREGGNH